MTVVLSDVLLANTRFVPDGCPIVYPPGPRTVVVEARGWEERDIDVTAEVFQHPDDRWDVILMPGKN